MLPLSLWHVGACIVLSATVLLLHLFDLSPLLSTSSVTPHSPLATSTLGSSALHWRTAPSEHERMTSRTLESVLPDFQPLPSTRFPDSSDQQTATGAGEQHSVAGRAPVVVSGEDEREEEYVASPEYTGLKAAAVDEAPRTVPADTDTAHVKKVEQHGREGMFAEARRRQAAYLASLGSSAAVGAHHGRDSPPNFAQPLHRPVLDIPSSPGPADGYLLFLPVSGFGNQVLGIAKAIALANYYNRSLVVAPLLSSHLMDPHRTAYYNMYGIAGGDGSRLSARFNLTRVVSYETYYQFAHISRHATLRPMVMLSDFIRRHGLVHECWDGPNPVPDLAPYVNTADTVLCVGRAYSLKLPHMEHQVSTPIHQWLRFDAALVRDVTDWLTAQPALDLSSFACVHYRAGDFQGYLRDKYVNLTGLVEYMASTGHPLNDNTVIITNTESSEERALLRQLGWASVSLDDISLPPQHGWLPIYREVKLIFMEQFICQQAHVFVGCRYSSFSGLINTMRHCGWGNHNCHNYCYRE